MATKQNHTIKFEVDFMLGKLAKVLRLLGIDAEYVKYSKSEISLKNALKNNRILLTRSHKFIQSNNLYIIKSENLEEQIKELEEKFNIIEIIKPFSRCIVCNTILEKKEKVEGKVPFYIYQTHNEFSYCHTCDKYYWKGTHYKKMSKFISNLLPKLNSA